MQSLLLKIFIAAAVSFSSIEANEHREPKDDLELRRWLENMVWHHRFETEEIQAATGLTTDEIENSLKKHNIGPGNRPERAAGEPLLVLPYPGGRHPRIGFLDGAIDPQRETKLSIFTPWDSSSYVVADVPEAIWSNLGLTYLAHKHIPTIWDEQKIDLPKLEWRRRPNGDYLSERTLPNGIHFGTIARARPEAVFMKMWLSNGTTRVLSDLRVQNCIMLKGASDFAVQSSTNKVLKGMFAAASSKNGNRWVISAWKPLHRAWENPPVPCIHSDPKFPDTAPGATSTIHGLLSFYEGTNVEEEFERLETFWTELEKL